MCGQGVIGCLVGLIGSWVWEWLPEKVRTWVINQVFRVALRWYS